MANPLINSGDAVLVVYAVSCEKIVSILFLAFANGMNVGFQSFWLSRYDNHFSLSMLSVSAVKDSATTSKSENLGTGPQRGTLPDSLTRFSENCLHISSILKNFV